MHTYLSKKIAIPNNTKLNCIDWHKNEGYVAIGGENGLLKVLKLDSGGNAAQGGTNDEHQSSRSAPLPSNLSMNLTLEGHSEAVQVIVWNEHLDKLTTSDSNGVIIVWMLYKGIWYEEMLNNRNKSTVSGMAWSSDGNKICIVYEDGAVIVGAANGNRIWGKELKDTNLTGVQWSPDANMLLFSVSKSQLHLYDNQGNFMMKLNNTYLDKKGKASSTMGSGEIVALKWYDGRYGYVGQNCPSLLIACESGHIFLYQDINDNDPVTFKVNMHVCFADWNHNASMIAVGCDRKDKANTGDKIGIQFYDNKGSYLRMLKLPGRKISACAWEGGGLRLAITVDSHIFFANIHPQYQWCYFKHTLVFSTGIWTPNGICVTFWDTHSNMVNVLHVTRLFALAAHGNLCVLATQFDSLKSPGKYLLLLCDTGGTIIDEKYIDIEPAFVTINSTLVVVSSLTHFLVWCFKSSRANSQITSRKKDYVYHINEIVTGEETLFSDPTSHAAQDLTNLETDSNNIRCLTCSESILLIGRVNGQVNQYQLPHISLVNKYTFSNKGISQMIRINCNNSKAAWICDGHLLVFNLRIDPGFFRGDLIGDGNEEKNRTNTNGEWRRLERKDVWDVCWAGDNPHMLAIMEKTRLYVFRGNNPEEPITCSGYLCSFHDLEIKTVLLDEIVANPDNLFKELIVTLEVKSLRDTRDLLNKVGIKEARQFIMDNPHPRLWRLLAEAALKQLDLATAEIAYVYCQDLSGIQFINQLNKNRNQNLLKAEIAVYTRDFDEAERIYIECDRRDLVLDLYKKLGDWFKVRQLMNVSMKGDSLKYREIYNGIGQYYTERYSWNNVKEYFIKSQNNEMLAMYYYNVDNFNALEQMITTLGRKDRLLIKIGDMLASVGLCMAAANAYAKFGLVQKAVTLCTKQNEWEVAVNLAKEHSIPEIGTVLTEYVNALVKDQRLPQGIQVYEKANRYLEAATLAFEHGKAIYNIEPTNIMKIKKWFIIGAMLVDKYRKQDKAFSSYKYESLVATRWRFAVAFHLYGLAQQSLLSGNSRQAFVIATKLREYDNILSERHVYTLLALTSRMCEAYSMCSKAFVKLITSPQIVQQDKDKFSRLAESIFKKQAPKDKQIVRKECVHCETMIPDWCHVCPSCDIIFPTCLITGQPIMDPKLIWTCSNCLENMDVREMMVRSNCVLCSHQKVSVQDKI